MGTTGRHGVNGVGRVVVVMKGHVSTGLGLRGRCGGYVEHVGSVHVVDEGDDG